MIQALGHLLSCEVIVSQGASSGLEPLCSTS